MRNTSQPAMLLMSLNCFIVALMCWLHLLRIEITVIKSRNAFLVSHFSHEHSLVRYIQQAELSTIVQKYKVFFCFPPTMVLNIVVLSSIPYILWENLFQNKQDCAKFCFDAVLRRRNRRGRLKKHLLTFEPLFLQFC